MLDTASAVSAVVSAFHSAADCMVQIRKRSLKSNRAEANRLLQEKLLLEILELGKHQISERYTFAFHELGVTFKLGDGRSKVVQM